MRTLRGRVPRTVVVAIALGGALVAGAGTDALAAMPHVSAVDTTWQTVWRDDFSGRAGTLPGTAWRVDLGHSYPGGPANWGTGEIQSYTADPANLSQDGLGNLRITATRDQYGAWRSARIETVRDDFQPPSGGRLRIEARVQLPAGGKGYWPAFWALGAPYRVDRSGWPASGELDLMENINGQSIVHGTVHCGQPLGGPCHEDTGLTGAYQLRPVTGFHVYTMVWSGNPGRFDWYVDGNLYWTVTAATMGRTAWNAVTGHGFFVLLNLAVGGSWPGLPDATTRAGEAMLVDYVAVSRSGGSLAGDAT
jgi:beta-glucanase (GH16 family)